MKQQPQQQQQQPQQQQQEKQQQIPQQLGKSKPDYLKPEPDYLKPQEPAYLKPDPITTLTTAVKPQQTSQPALVLHEQKQSTGFLGMTSDFAILFFFVRRPIVLVIYNIEYM